MVTEIMAREKYGLLAVPRTVPVQLTCYVYSAHVLETGMQSTLCLRCERLVTCTELQKCLSFFSHAEYCDMHCVFGFCNGNARAAVEEKAFSQLKDSV